MAAKILLACRGCRNEVVIEVGSADHGRALAKRNGWVFKRSGEDEYAWCGVCARKPQPQSAPVDGRTDDPQLMESVVRLYRGEGWAPERIVRYLRTEQGVALPVNGVLEILREAGVPRRPPGWERKVSIPDLDKRLQRYHTGEKIRRLAEEIGLTEHMLYKRMRERTRELVEANKGEGQ